MADRYIVMLTTQRAAWGPFESPEDAGEFAGFVTAEIDPAEVRTLSSPWGELLAWRETMKGLDQ